LPGLEDPALRIDQRDALTAEIKPAREIGRIEHAALEESEPVYMVESRLAKLGVLACGVRRRDLHGS
jgi:hypothetical protein